MLIIGDQKINTNVLMSPMSGCSDLAFRLIAREQGAKFCYYEMIDANSLVYKSQDDSKILKTTAKDRPIAAQLVGGDPKNMLLAAKRLLALIKPQYLEINAACPVKKVVSKKGGAYLLKDPPRLLKIVKSFVAEFDLPITMKIRTGYHVADIPTLIKTVVKCQKAGIAAIVIHGRTRDQGYSGDIDYAAIKVVKGAVEIPVIGSGNIFNHNMAKKMFDETGCNGVVVARGGLGNPWIFNDIANYLKSGKLPSEVPWSTKKKVLLKHLGYIRKFKEPGPEPRVGFMRKIAIWYIKAIPDAGKLRNKITLADSYDQMLEIIEGIN
jgi:tRNA-dihydrouridine synthase B